MNYKVVQSMRKQAAYDTPDIIWSGRYGHRLDDGTAIEIPMTVSNKPYVSKKNPDYSKFLNEIYSEDGDFTFQPGSHMDEEAYDASKVLETKGGKKPHQYSSTFGNITSLLLPVIGGAAIGGASNFAGKRDDSVAYGAALGSGVYLLAQLLGFATGSTRKVRSKKDQKSYNESSTIPEWLIPGVAAHNAARSAKRSEKDFMERPAKLYQFGKDPGISVDNINEYLESDDPVKQLKGQRFLNAIEEGMEEVMDRRYTAMHPYSE